MATLGQEDYGVSMTKGYMPRKEGVNGIHHYPDWIGLRSGTRGPIAGALQPGVQNMRS